MRQSDDALFYQLYFQTPGVAEAELERDVHRSIRRLLYSGSGDARRRDTPGGGASVGMVPRQGGFLDRTVAPDSLPRWLSEADIDVFAGEFVRTGFRGGLNWYRNIDRNWELLAPFAGVRVMVPALYVAGDRDLVIAFRGMDQVISNLSTFVPNLRGTAMLPGCGHWTQQERPREVNDAITTSCGSCSSAARDNPLTSRGHYAASGTKSMVVVKFHARSLPVSLAPAPAPAPETARSMAEQSYGHFPLGPRTRVEPTLPASRVPT